jgi:hypothetical protein
MEIHPCVTTRKMAIGGIVFRDILIHLKHIYNFLCFMLVYTPFALCFGTLRGIFMHFPEITY